MKKGPQCHPSNTRAQQLKRAREMAVCVKLCLVSYIALANSDGSGENARMRRLA